MHQLSETVTARSELNEWQNFLSYFGWGTYILIAVVMFFVFLLGIGVTNITRDIWRPILDDDQKQIPGFWTNGEVIWDSTNSEFLQLKFDDEEKAAKTRSWRKRAGIFWVAYTLLLFIPGMAFMIYGPKDIQIASEAATADTIIQLQSVAPTTLDKITLDGAKKIAKGNAQNGYGTVTVAGTDGTVREIPVSYAGFGQLKAEQGVTSLVAKGETISVSRQEQNSWVVFSHLGAIYGLPADMDWSGVKNLPTVEPTKFATFGSVNVVTANGGKYNQLNATLIWDGEYKLISASSGLNPVELPRVRK